MDNTENTEAVVTVNPLLSRVEMPGSTYQIPSRGIFYNNGELQDDVDMGEVHVQPMSAYDEILLKTPDALFSGEAIRKVFKRCIPQILKPMDLLSRDVDFLLVCLRQVTFGSSTEMSFLHDCKDAKRHNYTVDISTFIANTKRIDPTTLGDLYTTKTPNGQVVKLHPPTLKNVIKMYQLIGDADITPEEELTMMVFTVSAVIESVDEISDSDMIEEWIKKIPAGWVTSLNKTIDRISDFGPSMTFTTKCKDCDNDIKIESPINPISFFI